MPNSFYDLYAYCHISIMQSRYLFLKMDGSSSVRVPWPDGATPASLLKSANELGFQAFGPDAVKRLTDLLSKGMECTPKLIIDHPGYTEPYFAQPTGRVFSPKKVKSASAAFPVPASLSTSAGTLKKWKKRVAAPLAGQTIPMLVTMLSFGAVLQDVLGVHRGMVFELVGPTSTGKTIAQEVAASVFGSIDHVPTPFSALANDLTAQLTSHIGALMLLDDPQLALAGASQAKVAASARDVILGMSDGVRVPGSRVERRTRPVASLFASREPLLDLVGAETAVGKVIADRLITLTIGRERAFGVFDDVPDEYGSGSAFADALRAAARKLHGSAGERFLQRLVQDLADDEGAFRARVNQHIHVFRDQAGIDPGDGAGLRIADAFGLVYAAGRLARDYGALPESWKVGSAVLSCFQQQQISPAPAQPYGEQLAEIAAGAGVVMLGDGAEPTPEDVAAGQVFVSQRSGGRQLFLLPAARETFFPAWRGKQPPPGLDKYLIKEKGHLQVKRRLHKSMKKQVRVYAFRLDDLTE